MSGRGSRPGRLQQGAARSAVDWAAVAGRHPCNSRMPGRQPQLRQQASGGSHRSLTLAASALGPLQLASALTNVVGRRVPGHSGCAAGQQLHGGALWAWRGGKGGGEGAVYNSGCCSTGPALFQQCGGTPLTTGPAAASPMQCKRIAPQPCGLTSKQEAVRVSHRHRHLLAGRPAVAQQQLKFCCPPSGCSWREAQLSSEQRRHEAGCRQRHQHLAGRRCCCCCGRAWPAANRVCCLGRCCCRRWCQPAAAARCGCHQVRPVLRTAPAQAQEPKRRQLSWC